MSKTEKRFFVVVNAINGFLGKAEFNMQRFKDFDEAAANADTAANDHNIVVIFLLTEGEWEAARQGGISFRNFQPFTIWWCGERFDVTDPKMAWASKELIQIVSEQNKSLEDEVDGQAEVDDAEEEEE